MPITCDFEHTRNHMTYVAPPFVYWSSSLSTSSDNGGHEDEGLIISNKQEFMKHMTKIDINSKPGKEFMATGTRKKKSSENKHFENDVDKSSDDYRRELRAKYRAIKLLNAVFSQSTFS
eukprot:CAMPEP_0194180648 /NCGR_PEP_ID=MMETSP0154-20130528/17388_1 /TAXON_ID=1049557 /ORGANISM="Thalassiothrix antarctica, Strain L6-D1" /LENGTH=118 /DNA_ID=CAMNT_0038896385 /DNA_START=99 /DNA_END=455 /DNA_ORIENTATION=+